MELKRSPLDRHGVVEPRTKTVDMSDPTILFAIAAGGLAFALLFRPFFGAKKDFWECVAYSFKSDFVSWLQKDLQRDYGKSMKLGFFLLLVIGTGWITRGLAWEILNSR